MSSNDDFDDSVPWWWWVWMAFIVAVVLGLIIYGFVSWNMLQKKPQVSGGIKGTALGFAIAGIFFPLLEIIPIVLFHVN